jgi:hypothetical protein
MEKNADPWKEIQSLIHREKEDALRDYRRNGFFPLPAETRRSTFPGRFWWRLHLPSAVLASAAVLLLAAVGAAIWISRGTERRLQADRLSALLADSLLYSGGERTTAMSETPYTAESSLTPVMTAMAGLTGWTRSKAPEKVDPAATVEHADPAIVKQKIGKMIRENAFEHLITRYCRSCKEV